MLTMNSAIGIPPGVDDTASSDISTLRGFKFDASDRLEICLFKSAMGDERGRLPTTLDPAGTASMNTAASSQQSSPGRELGVAVWQ